MGCPPARGGRIFRCLSSTSSRSAQPARRHRGHHARRRKALMVYDWPGNVRELESIESMVVMDDRWRAGHGRPHRRARAPPQADGDAQAGRRQFGRPHAGRGGALLHRAALRLTSGNREEAARCWASANARSTARSRTTTSPPPKPAGGERAIRSKQRNRSQSGSA